MGVVDKISSDRSLMLGRHFLMTAKSAAEIRVPEPGCAVLLECWTGSVVQPPQEPGFGMENGAWGGQGGEKCWYGWATGAAGCACEKMRGWFCRIAWVWMGCVCTAAVCCGSEVAAGMADTEERVPAANLCVYTAVVDTAEVDTVDWSAEPECVHTCTVCLFALAAVVGTVDRGVMVGCELTGICLWMFGKTVLATDGRSPKPGLVRPLSVWRASTAAWRVEFWASEEEAGTGEPVFRPYVK